VAGGQCSLASQFGFSPNKNLGPLKLLLRRAEVVCKRELPELHLRNVLFEAPDDISQLRYDERVVDLGA
jgi:hypothetical protein